MFLQYLLETMHFDAKKEVAEYLVKTFLRFCWRKIKPILKSLRFPLIVLFVLFILWLEQKGIITLSKQVKNGALIICAIVVILIIGKAIKPGTLKTSPGVENPIA